MYIINITYFFSICSKPEILRMDKALSFSSKFLCLVYSVNAWSIAKVTFLSLLYTCARCASRAHLPQTGNTASCATSLIAA